MNKKCLAKTRANSSLCQRFAMQNGRCHLHGGKSTGAKTLDGKLRQKMASWKHGLRSKEVIHESKQVKVLMAEHKKFLQEIAS